MKNSIIILITYKPQQKQIKYKSSLTMGYEEFSAAIHEMLH